MQKEIKEVFHQVEMPDRCVLNIEKAIEQKKEGASFGKKQINYHGLQRQQRQW